MIVIFFWLFPEAFFHSKVIEACPPVTTDKILAMSLFDTNSYNIITCSTSMYKYDDSEGSLKRNGVSMFLGYRSVPLKTDTTTFFIRLLLLSSH